MAVACTVLKDFGNATNLRMNCSKSECMIIGQSSNLVEAIVTQNNIRLTHQICHLGILLDDKLIRMNENWSRKIKKMNELKNLLLRLRPTLATKLLLTKTFLLSQITYIAPVIPISQAQLKDIEKTILSFLFPRRKTFSAARAFQEISTGGLGLPTPEHFIESLITKFAARALNSTQPWATLVKSFFPLGDITLSPIALPPLSDSSRVSTLVSSLNSLSNNFYKAYPRKWSSPIFHSNTIKNPFSNDQGIKPLPLWQNSLLASATIGSLYNFSQGRIFTSYEIGSRFNYYPNSNEYLRLSSILIHNLPQKKDRPNSRPTPSSLKFLLNKNPTAKVLRYLLHPPVSDLSRFQEIKVLCSLSNNDFMVPKKIQMLNLWRESYLFPELKNFCLFHCNNKNILNLYRSRFMNDTSPDCSFCHRIPSTDRIPGESFEHLYLECNFTKTLSNAYFTNLLNRPINVRDVLAHGSQEENPISLIINLEVLLFSHYIFQCKMSAKFPTLQSFLHLSYTYKKMFLRASPKYRRSYTFVCKKSGDHILIHNKLLER